MLLLFLAAGMTSAFGQSLTISDFDIELGETQDVTISVVADEGQSVYGVQTDVILSEGLSLESAAAIGEGLMLTKNEQEGGAIRIGLLSLSGNSIPAGEAIKLTIKADAGLQEGTVTLSNSRLTISTSGTEVKVKDAIANVTPAKPGLTLSDFTVTAGSTAKATIRLTRGGLTVYGVQTDIMLPDGLTVTNVSAPNGYVSKNTLTDGAVRVALLMLDGTTLSSGDIITLTIKAEADAESGEVSLSNSRLTTSTSGTEQKVEDTQAQATVEESDEADIIVNATPGDLTAAINEAVEGKTVKSLTVNLLDAGTYTVSGTISTPGDFALNGTDGAVIDATQLSDALITLDGTNAMAVKEDGTESDHKLISTVMINDVTITGLQSSLIKDAQKTLLEEFIIDNSVIEVPASNKSVVDFNGKGYVGKVVVSNSTIWAKDKHTGFFAQYGSRPS